MHIVQGGVFCFPLAEFKLSVLLPGSVPVCCLPVKGVYIVFRFVGA